MAWNRVGCSFANASVAPAAAISRSSGEASERPGGGDVRVVGRKRVLGQGLRDPGLALEVVVHRCRRRTRGGRDRLDRGGAVALAREGYAGGGEDALLRDPHAPRVPVLLGEGLAGLPTAGTR